MLPDCRTLEAYRLAKDYSWAELAAAMKKRHAEIPARTLNYLLTRAPEDSIPRDRTLVKIRRFLSWARRQDRRAMMRARVIAREQQIHHERLQDHVQ